MRRIAGQWLLVLVLTTGIRAQGADELTGFFPDIAGWKIKEKPLVFHPANLWEYIDGAAENFLNYEFRQLAVQVYQNAAGRELTIEVYRHSTPRNAFGIYGSEKSLAGNFLAIGAEAYQEEGVLNFFFGPFYVKISAYDLESKEQAVVPDVAQRLAGAMGRQQGLPAELAFFPPAGKLAHSERFLLKNFLGHTFLNSAFRADYEKNGKKYQVFLITAKSREEAQAMLKKWIELAEKKQAEPRQEIVYEIADPYNGKVIAEWKGSYFWGSIKCPDEEAAGVTAELKKSVIKLGW